MRRSVRRWPLGLLGLTVIIMVLLLASWEAGPPWQLLVVSDPLAPADAIVPLAGEQKRPVEAARLFAAGYAPRVAITNLPVSRRWRAEYRRQVTSLLARGGVPETEIVLVPGIAESTYEEAVNVRAFAEEKGWRSLIVVTSAWHTRRSRVIFRQVFAGSGITVLVHPVDPPSDWWGSEDARHTVREEYLKLVAHVLGAR